MSGNFSLRGYLVQTIISILQAFQEEENWEAFALEPLHESEKVDIKWRYAQHVKVVQVKSSQNTFGKPQAKAICNELKSSTNADYYEIQLVGRCTGPLASLNEYEGVKISKRDLDIDRMIEQIAYSIDKYCEQQEIPSTLPSMREQLVKYLTGELIFRSTKGEYITRSQFNEWLVHSIFLQPYENADLVIDLTSVKFTAESTIPLDKSWIQSLWVRKLSEPPRLFNKYQLQELLVGNDKLIIIGISGSGKTSMMKTAAKLLNEDTKKIYFWIPLKSYSQSLENTIKRLFGWQSLPDNKVFPTLQKHKVGLLLDGLNEVAEGQRERCITEIESLLHSYQACVCISYPSTDHTFYDFGYSTYEILPLENEQIFQAIETFYKKRDTPNKVEFLIREVRYASQEKEAFLKLFQTPLHLQFLFELAESRDFGHQTLRDLYGQIIEKRLTKIGARKQRGEISLNTKIKCLMVLAFRSIIEDHKLQMSSAYTKEIFLNCVEQSELDITIKEILRSGLLVEFSNHFVEWPHPSFRDYLAGRYLFELVDVGKPVDDFPFGEVRGLAAVAHAVRLATTEPVAALKRSQIFLALLRKKPKFETVQAAAAEYNIVNDTNHQYENQKNALEYFKQVQWGERFVVAYRLLIDMAYQEKFPGLTKIPNPNGLVVFFDQQANFSLILFSERIGMEYSELNNIEPLIEQAKKHRQSLAGFCLYAPFLQLLDPEIMAYIEVGKWLRFMTSLDKDVDERLTKWHDNLSSLIKTPNDYANWTKLDLLPKPKTDLCLGPQETIRFLYQHFPRDVVESITSIADISPTAKEELLSWENFFVPATFKIDPLLVHEKPQVVSSRFNQVMVLTPPSHYISLIMLLPSISKVDRGINLYVPSPVQILNRYYFLYSSFAHQISNGTLMTFAHLRG